MKQSPKENISARIDSRTKWVLQEVAKVKRQTISELIDDILSSAVEFDNSAEAFIVGTNPDGMYFRAFKEEYDKNVAGKTEEEYNISELKAKIENINITALNSMLSDVDIIWEKIETSEIFGLITTKEVEELAILINNKCGKDIIPI